MSVSLKGCSFEHTELSIHFDWFNDEYAIVKDAKDANLLKSGIKTYACYFAAEFVSFKIEHPCLKTDTF